MINILDSFVEHCPVLKLIGKRYNCPRYVTPTKRTM